MHPQKKIKMPLISFVVARSYPQNIIGCENKLPWELKTDLKRFRSITSGHAIIMGSKTFYSIGKVLPKRENIVISRKQHNISEKDLYWCNDKETALFLADIFSLAEQRKEIFVIGGQEMYKLFENVFNKIHLTEVFAGKKIRGDAYFEYKFDKRKWKTLVEDEIKASEEDQFPYRYTVYENKEEKNRFKWASEFLTDSKNILESVSKYKSEHPVYSKNVDSIMHQQFFPDLIVKE